MTNWQDHIKQRLESPLALLAILTVATLTLFIRGLLSSDPVVPSGTGTDLIEQFAYWRQFGFSQLRHGHIVLWNPYEYSGSPFLGGWQSGILYPPNFIYLFLPLAKAIDVEFILHIIWAGFGVALWSRYNRFDPFASLTAAFVTMFGGALFPHVYAGHLAPIDAMSWIPWIIFAVDQLLDRPNLRSTLLLTVSIAMSILAGHPQTVFFGFVAVSLYCVMRFVAAPHKMKSLAAFVAAGCWSVALTSMQIDAGLAADSEGVRRFGVPFDFAASFSFPPENLITFICPWFSER